MRELYIKLPMHRKSKKPIPILDENRQVIGHIQRYLKSKTEKAMDIISIYELPTAILNVVATDENGEVLTDLKAHPNWFSKQTWDMEYIYNKEKYSCEVKNTNLIKANSLKEFEYTTRGNFYKIKVKGRNAVFYINNNILAEAVPADKNPLTDKYVFRIHTMDENVLSLVSLFYLFINTD
ncbi:hypothetical protein B4U37_21645 (plasmid) [Sutcliffiella horikoshii]|uniref:Tubby C-terminal domain-containing protein n=1 Tax=Sutcliffiella horikoshii TaxID=79883 RepID=A0ABM6KRJ0_9BACI|nr:hypothetical protein [Sutcliffiella horikoshii]ART78718.1 hypothetical protein B4U37_21645 [Sutcliffiella horikoshii]